MTDQPEPCPFCGSGETQINENRMSPRMDGTSTLISVDLRHWCAPDDDDYAQTTTHIRARDKAQAIKVWNRRESDGETHAALRRALPVMRKTIAEYLDGAMIGDAPSDITPDDWPRLADVIRAIVAAEACVGREEHDWPWLDAIIDSGEWRE